MYVVPKVMSTQHPDNAMRAPFADDAGVLKGEGEIEEAVSVFAMAAMSRCGTRRAKKPTTMSCGNCSPVTQTSSGMSSSSAGT